MEADMLRVARAVPPRRSRARRGRDPHRRLAVGHEKVAELDKYLALHETRTP